MLVAAALGVAGTLGIASAQVRIKQFTSDDVRAIATTLRDADPRLYLVRLPVFSGSRIVGSQVYGSLPMREVELLADSMHIRLDRNANVISVFDPSEGDDSGGGGGGGGGDGGGPGSHINTQSAAWDLADRVDILLRDIDVNTFQFLR